jgi:5-methyltetrahydrofolate--homocysteine methyltransferase
MHTVLSSPGQTVTIGHDQPFCIIGERINPTGRKKFQLQLREGDLSAIEKDVADQIAGGANVLDVNMGVPLTDEPALLSKAITLIQSISDVPICIDSSIIEALQAGLETYQGKALVNSVTGEDDRMELVLPLIKKHGAAIIALPNDETGIPATAAERMVITEKIVRAVEKHGIPLEDLVIDPLAMTVGADPEAVKITLETIYLIREKWGLNMTLGASNISFGLPYRHALNAAFLPAAMSHGLTSAVMDARTPLIVESVRAADLLLGLDPWGSNWITRFRAMEAAKNAADTEKGN